MQAHKGDRIVVRGRNVGMHVRDGEVVDVPHEDGSPPYRVRWSDDDHETLMYPGPDAYVETRDTRE